MLAASRANWPLRQPWLIRGANRSSPGSARSQLRAVNALAHDHHALPARAEARRRTSDGHESPNPAQGRHRPTESRRKSTRVREQQKRLLQTFPERLMAAVAHFRERRPAVCKSEKYRSVASSNRAGSRNYEAAAIKADSLVEATEILPVRPWPSDIAELPCTVAVVPESRAPSGGYLCWPSRRSRKTGTLWGGRFCDPRAGCARLVELKESTCAASILAHAAIAAAVFLVQLAAQVAGPLDVAVGRVQLARRSSFADGPAACR